jgi:hypothetical protein
MIQVKARDLKLFYKTVSSDMIDVIYDKNVPENQAIRDGCCTLRVNYKLYFSLICHFISLDMAVEMCIDIHKKEIKHFIDRDFCLTMAIQKEKFRVLLFKSNLDFYYQTQKSDRVFLGNNKWSQTLMANGYTKPVL